MWEGAVAAPASPLGWHSRVPVEVFFHTGHHHSTQELAREFTRQLDRQLSALSLLSAQRLLEGIRAYRAQGRQPTSTSTRNDKKLFMDKVVGDLVHVHHLSREDARARTAEVDRALVVLHESDQVTYGPSQPATTTEGWPSLGHGAVSSSIGGQGRPVATVLEQATLAVPAAPSRPATPDGRHPSQAGPATPAPDPRGGPGQDHHPSHPDGPPAHPAPHQKPEAQPRPRPIRGR